MFQMDSEFIENLECEDFVNCRFKIDRKFGDYLRNKYKFALIDLICSYSKKFIDNHFSLAQYPVE